MYIAETNSTNDLLRQHPEYVTVRTDFQTSGRGQQGNGWESERSKNLLFSTLLLRPQIAVEKQFILSMAVCVALRQAVLDTIGTEVLKNNAPLCIKWPNDLYAGDKKLAGILIENSLQAGHIEQSIIGIGLNVNQMQFQNWPTHPISMKMVLGKDVELEPLLERLVAAVDQRVQRLRFDDGIAEIKRDYLERMFRYRQWGDYETKEGNVKRFITGLDPFGRLETIDENGRKFVYDIKEIKFV